MTRRSRTLPRLIYATSETDADILYPTGFIAPDPFLFVQKGSRRLVVIDDLEIDRARAQARVQRVLSWSVIARRSEKDAQATTAADVIARILRVLKIRRVEVPSTFPLGLSRGLEQRRIRLRIGPDPFWREREIKRPDEIRAVARSLRAAEAGLTAGIEALRSCRIGSDGGLRNDGRRFTAEDLRAVINSKVMAEGCVPAHTVCASGDQAVDPHQEGHGPLRAHQPIVIDVFPRSERTGYYGDLTRTVVRGRASDRLREVYALVHQGMQLAKQRIRDGVDGASIHNEIQSLFDRNGYRTGVRNGRMQGFFHGTGHGLGLAVHEAPLISRRSSELKTGHVVTVEPGLYYLGLGGVRLEDVVVVARTGCRTLTRVPKVLEI